MNIEQRTALVPSLHKTSSDESKTLTEQAVDNAETNHSVL